MAGRDPRRKKLQALIQREGIVSQMSDTKWMRLIEALQEAELPIRYRIKLLTDPDISDWGWWFARIPANYIEMSSIVPVLALEVEWLEIDATGPWRSGVVDQVLVNPVDYSEEVVSLLKSARVPYTVNDKVFRVAGHLRRT